MGVMFMRCIGILSVVLVLTFVPGSVQEAQAGPPGTATRNMARLWMDACAAPSQAAMQAWWPVTPYYAIGIYIGGSARGCSQPNLTATWVSNLHAQGYQFAPIWVGPQAPCGDFFSEFSYDQNTARSQGNNEAFAAMNAANALGFTEFTIIYYDMEYYDPNNVSCRNAVLAFLDGWTLALHNNTRVSGAYSSSCAGINYWATIANVPDQVWFANYDGRATVWFDPCINNGYWVQAQRHHQYVRDSTETWAGYTIIIDRNCANGLLAGANTWGTPVYPPNYAGCP